MVFIYALELNKGKYYVGKTCNPSFRMEQHFVSKGSAWTSLYTPLRMVELIPDCDDFDEDKHTIKYMKKHGVDNVRGGSFCQVVLSDEIVNTVNQMIKGGSNACYTCGECGHYTKTCKKRVVKKESATLSNEKCKCPTSWFSPHRKITCALNVIKTCFQETTEDKDKDMKQVDRASACSRCGRASHQAEKCYASTHMNGTRL